MRQNDEFDEDDENGECSNIELYDMVMDPRLWPPQPQQPRQRPHMHPCNFGGPEVTTGQEDPVVGLRNTLTCCVMPPNFRQNYGQL